MNTNTGRQKLRKEVKAGFKVTKYSCPKAQLAKRRASDSNLEPLLQCCQTVLAAMLQWLSKKSELITLNSPDEHIEGECTKSTEHRRVAIEESNEERYHGRQILVEK